MRKSIPARIALTLCLITALFLALCACSRPYVDPVGTATVVVAKGDSATEYEVHLSLIDGTRGAFGALDYLEENGMIEYESAEGMFGAYLTHVGEVREIPSEGIYVGIWTDNVLDADTSGFLDNVYYNGKELYPSGVGISSMSLYDKTVIYIGEIVY